MPYLDKNPSFFKSNPEKSEPFKKPDMPKDRPLFHGESVSDKQIDTNLKKMEYDQKWNQDLRTKLDHEDFVRLKAVLENPNYISGGITDPELRSEVKKWKNDLHSSMAKLNPFKADDFEQIKRARREVKFLEEKLEEKP